jgi:hypothetical protein
MSAVSAGHGRVGACGSENKSLPEASPMREGTCEGFWRRVFLWRFVLTRRSKGWVAQDRRSSLMAVVKIRTSGFAGDRRGAWRRVGRFLAMKFSGFGNRALMIRAVGRT